MKTVRRLMNVVTLLILVVPGFILVTGFLSNSTALRGNIPTAFCFLIGPLPAIAHLWATVCAWESAKQKMVNRATAVQAMLASIIPAYAWLVIATVVPGVDFSRRDFPLVWLAGLEAIVLIVVGTCASNVLYFRKILISEKIASIG